MNRRIVSRESVDPEIDWLDVVPVRLARIKKKVAGRARKTRKERR